MSEWPRCAIASKLEYRTVYGPGDEVSCAYHARDCGLPKFAASPTVCATCPVHLLTLRAEAAEANLKAISQLLSAAEAKTALLLAKVEALGVLLAQEGDGGSLISEAAPK